MSLSSSPIFFEPDLDHWRVNLTVVLEAWDEVQRNSVEVATSNGNAGSVFEFSSSSECIYFASINRYLLKPVEGKNEAKEKKKDKKRKLSDPELEMAPTMFQLNSSPLDNDAWDLVPEDENLDDTLQTVDQQSEISTLEADPMKPLPSLPSDGLSPSKSAPQAAKTSNITRSETVGVIYLAPGQFLGEVSLGLAIAHGYRGKGLGRQAVGLLLQWAFDEARYHRVQVMLMDGPGRPAMMGLFSALGFAHEGTRRRQVLSPFSAEYKDVTYMAILDTEWSIRHYFQHAPNSLWDELFRRHQREREELLEWDAGRSKLKRTQSMETVKMGVDDAALSRKSDKGEMETAAVTITEGPLDIEDVTREVLADGPHLHSSPRSLVPASSVPVGTDWDMNSSNDSAASSPPPSETSGWETDSGVSGSSGSWDKFETSSVASSGFQSISGDLE